MTAASAALEPDDQRPVPVRHPGRWAAVAVIVVIAGTLLASAAGNPNFGWDVVGTYLFSGSILAGLVTTLELTAIAMVVGIVIGTLVAVMRVSKNPVLSGASWLYIWFFRGTPLLVQLIFWYNLGSLYRTLSLGVPFGPTFFQANATSIITPLAAAILGLGLNEGAYMAEIVRAGVQSVDPGQLDAAASLGLSRFTTLRNVVLPQAMRVIIPPTGNETIGMLKTTSLVSVIAVPELLFSAQVIYSRTFDTIPLLIVASVWYLIVTSILTLGQFFLERRFGRGSGRSTRPPAFARLRSLRGRRGALG